MSIDEESVDAGGDADKKTGENSGEGDDEYQDTKVINSRFRTSALPHPHRPEGLEWIIDSCSLDNGREIDVKQDELGMSVSLVAEAEWEVMTLKGTVSVSEDVYDDVTDSTEVQSSEEPPTELVAIIHCKKSILRDAEKIESPAGPGKYDFEIKINRDHIYGTVEVVPSLIRRENYASPTSAYATTAGNRLADGPSVRIKVDVTRDIRGVLHPRRRRFSDDDSLPPEDHLVHLKLQGDDAPQIYLNKDHGSEVLDVLDSDARQGKVATARDLAFDVIESQLWPQLIYATGESVSGGELEEDWMYDVLREIREPIYGDVSLTEAAEMLSEDISSAESSSRLQRDIEDFVQSRETVNTPKRVKKLIEFMG